MTCIFSPDRRYRYTLQRDWLTGKGLVNFLMLNPSTADETKNDPTIERCERRARRMGFAGLVVTNIFAFRATDPKEMMRQIDPIGYPSNDYHILDQARRCEMVICGWGNHGKHRFRSASVREMLCDNGVKLHALRVSKTGEPWHPLYVGYDVEPTEWLTPQMQERHV